MCVKLILLKNYNAIDRWVSGWFKQQPQWLLAWPGRVSATYYKAKHVSFLMLWLVSEAENMIPTHRRSSLTLHWASIHVEPPLKTNVYTHPHINPQCMYLLDKISWHSDINMFAFLQEIIIILHDLSSQERRGSSTVIRRMCLICESVWDRCGGVGKHITCLRLKSTVIVKGGDRGIFLYIHAYLERKKKKHHVFTSFAVTLIKT